MKHNRVDTLAYFNDIDTFDGLSFGTQKLYLRSQRRRLYGTELSECIVKNHIRTREFLPMAYEAISSRSL